MHVSWLLFMIPKILSLDLLLFTTSIRPEAEFHTVMQWQTIQNQVELFGKCKKAPKGGIWILYWDYPGTSATQEKWFLPMPTLGH